MGGDVLVEALEQKGVKAVFEYPGGASWEIQETKLKCLVDLPRRSTGYSKTAFTPSCSRALTSTSPPVLGWSGENQETNLSGVAEWTFENFQMAAEEGWPVVIPREGEGTSSRWIFWVNKFALTCECERDRYVMNADEGGNGMMSSLALGLISLGLVELEILQRSGTSTEHQQQAGAPNEPGGTGGFRLPEARDFRRKRKRNEQNKKQNMVVESMFCS
ncbi:hypothetical protein Vadar_014765 [Vaccinium darrowii]|uniref:Uncharacterized protein n=1 Tax=Vaccinium darrowii TaxID=229202 RepID=A0ACB7XA86_9ERIC|nr:hypothetical protein Vadar_014765 [Vaccinium darrowii]